MGGANTQLQQTPEVTDAVPAPDQAQREQLQRQGMSGPADQSASHLFRQLKGAGQEFYTNSKKLIDSAASMASPNFFGRQTSSAPTSDTENK